MRREMYGSRSQPSSATGPQPNGGSRCIFLDRDGVINHDSETYIKNIDEFTLIDGSCEAIATLSRAGWPVIVVTNQSALARGLIDRMTLERIHERLIEDVRRCGGSITDILFCPHHPANGCSCRKPGIAMLLEAASRHGLDLSRSIMVGDSARDIECGIRAGCRTVLVLTGNGRKALAELTRNGMKPDAVFDSLREAADWLVGL
ncbi:MAG: D-glycero-beta-D-manno-heptose 1,7-bisphosphate 7-phosphatase [Thermodesulfobacteriota bacterium]